MSEQFCPRCGEVMLAASTGRPRKWCSQRCRRAAYEERRAAAAGAIALEVREIERVREIPPVSKKEPTIQECVDRVLASPRACKSVIEGLTAQADAGKFDRGSHAPLVSPIRKLLLAVLHKVH